ncbi:MAG: 16S rRNA (guanine(527)-N(7))-methyltransferase RsmG [Terriglobia bacterium]
MNGKRRHAKINDPGIDEVAIMLSETRILELLEPFGIIGEPSYVGLISIYLQLLLHWSEKINLTSIRNEEECVTRHFGESLLLSRYEDWTEGAKVLDIGSGAGFPGLALKLAFPRTETTLLEPIGKKRAFLKEVIRACEMEGVIVRPERIEQMAGTTGRYDAITIRAMGDLPGAIQKSRSLLAAGGRFHLWLSGRQRQSLEKSGFALARTLLIPLSRDREIVTWVPRD